ncbi:MAG: pre-peptidase C-terminal domain-containing protein [Colwellia sp.]|nr:pre-peptidase C-terminal domain-containing protein [Colwellia sp.]
MKYNKKNKLTSNISKILGGSALAMILTSSVHAGNEVIDSTYTDDAIVSIELTEEELMFIDDSQEIHEFFGADVMDTVSPSDFLGDIRDIDIVPDWMPGDAVISVPRRIYPNLNRSALSDPINKVMGDDQHLDDLQTDAQGTYQRAVSDGSVNIEGNGFSGVNPSDTTGTVGKNHYIQSINGSAGSIFSIYDKTTGNKISGPTAMSNLGVDKCKSAAGDPIVFYDEAAERYIMTEFSNEAGRSLCVYVSKTDNPVSGGWHAYEFQAPEFPDYPKFGRWGDSYFVGTNESAGPGIYALERSKMLAGQTARMQRKTAPKLAGLGFQMLLPVDVDTVNGPDANAPGLFLRQNDDELNNKGSNNANQDYLELWTFDPDYDNSANSKLVGPIKIAMSEFDSNVCSNATSSDGFGCLSQKGSSTKLDPVREVVMYRSQYRRFASHESIVGNFVHDAGSDRASLRWFELRKVGTGAWGLHQEGTYAPGDTNNRFMGSAAMDASGNIALAFHISGPETFPGISMTGRLATDANGTMTQTEKVLIAGTSHIASDRNGDYSHLSLDPVDGCTFWMTSDYGKENGQWSTRIASFKFAECSSSTATPAFTLQATNLTQQVCANTSITPIAISTAATGGFNKSINLNYANLPAGITGSFSTNPVVAGSLSNANIAIGNVNNGSYNFKINGVASGAMAKELSVALTVATKPGSVVLSAPISGATGAPLRPTFSWSADSSTTNYVVEVATDSAYVNKVATGTVANGTNYQPSADLKANTTYYWRVKTANTCGNTWSSTATFTTVAVISSNVLVKGVTKTGLNGAAQSTQDFSIAVPAGTTNLTFKTSGGTGDVDLHVQFGEKATADKYQCRPYQGGNVETCTIATAQTGTYHVMLLGYSAYAGVSITADYTPATTGGGNANIDKSNLSGAMGSESYYKINVPANASKLTVEISGGTGDVDLYLRKGSKPTANDYVCRPYEEGNIEKCTQNNPASGEWHIGLFAFDAFDGVSLKATVE